MTISPDNNAKAEDFINESEIPTPQSDAVGKVVKLESDGKLSLEFISTEISPFILKNTEESVDASILPIPVMINSSNRLLISDANDSDSEDFIGFLTKDYSNLNKPTFLNVDSGGNDSSTSITANAGTDRILIVITLEVLADNVTAVSWGGTGMTKIDEGNSPSGGPFYTKIWVLAIGDSVSNETETLSLTGGSARIASICYSGVDQTTLTQDSDVTGINSNSITGATLTGSDDIRYNVGVICSNNFTGDITNSRFNDRGAGHDDVITELGDLKSYSNIAFTGTQGASTSMTLASLILNPAEEDTQEVNLQHSGVVQGFTGLTPNAKYYVQNTEGTIGTSAGSTTILVGKAISATELLIIHD